MTALNKQALRSREEFEEYYNETHAVKVTSQFKRFGYYVSPTMQKAWELWQKAQSSMRDELEVISKSEWKLAGDLTEAQMNNTVLEKKLEAAEKRIAELERNEIREGGNQLDEYLHMMESAGIGVKGE